MSHDESGSEGIDDMLIVRVENESAVDLAYERVRKGENIPWKPMTA
jgi:hypothetical protein